MIHPLHYLKKQVYRKHMSYLLMQLYEKPSFWQVFKSIRPNKDKGFTSHQVLSELQEKAIRNNDYITFFELRIAALLKDMDYSSEQDTERNRNRLGECLQIKQQIEEIEHHIKQTKQVNNQL